MKFFIYDTVKINTLRVLLFLPTAVIFSMDVERTVSAGLYKDFSLKTQKSLTIFDPKKAVELGSEWEDIVPQSVLVAPDDKGVLLCSRGKVSYASFDTLCGLAVKSIIEHAYTKHSPLIATTLKEGSLLVVSTMNYKDPETAKPVSEYIECWNGSSKISKKLLWPIQAVTFFNTSAKTIVMASRNFIVAIDLETGKEYEKMTFRPLNKNDWIAHVAMNQDDTMMVIAGGLGSIQLIKVQKKENDVDLSHLNWVETKDNIAEVFYPNIDKLLYRTDKGEVKIASIYYILEPKAVTGLTHSHKINYVNVDEQETSSLENVDTRIFSYSTKYDSASIAPSDGIAAVHWSLNRNADEKIRHNVKIYRSINDTIEKFILKLSPVGEKCSYIKDGHLHVRNWTVISAAIRSNRVVVLGDDGKLRIHMLPHIGGIQDNNQQVAEVRQPFRRDTIKIQKTQRRRSLTFSAGDLPSVRDENTPRLNSLVEQDSSSSEKKNKLRRGSSSASPRARDKNKLTVSDPSISVPFAPDQVPGDGLQKKKSPRSLLKLSFDAKKGS